LAAMLFACWSAPVPIGLGAATCRSVDEDGRRDGARTLAGRSGGRWPHDRDGDDEPADDA
jgi:hypothetical protein